MAERDRAAVDVEPRRIDRQLGEAGEDLRGERLVQLDEVDRVERQAGAREHLADRRHRADAEQLRRDARRSRSRRSGRAASGRARRPASPTSRTTAAAPSLVCDELPAVTLPLAWKAGLSLASASSEVSRRGPSSVSTSRLRRRPARRPTAGAASTTSASTGTISSAKRPASMAAIALRWLSSAKASCASRVISTRARGSRRRARSTGRRRDRCRPASGWARRLCPPIGTRLIDSVPPAIDDVGRAALDPLGGVGNRLQAGGAEAVDGDRRGACAARRRAGWRCARRSGPARPRAWRSRGSRPRPRRGRAPGTRASAAVIAAAARSSGRVWRSAPSAPCRPACGRRRR